MLLKTHSEDACRGRHCVIHNPSNHHMRDWPVNWRADKNMVERICPHGIGHPDPDDAAYKESTGQEVLTIHGCDGCCAPPEHEWKDNTGDPGPRVNTWDDIIKDGKKSNPYD